MCLGLWSRDIGALCPLLTSLVVLAGTLFSSQLPSVEALPSISHDIGCLLRPRHCLTGFGHLVDTRPRVHSLPRHLQHHGSIRLRALVDTRLSISTTQGCIGLTLYVFNDKLEPGFIGILASSESRLMLVIEFICLVILVLCR